MISKEVFIEEIEDKLYLLLEEEKDAVEEFLASGSCTCHINPPCSKCTHPGNPLGLEYRLVETYSDIEMVVDAVLQLLYIVGVDCIFFEGKYYEY